MNLENFEVYKDESEHEQEPKKESQNDMKDGLNLKSIMDKFTSLIITALGVCTALAWNDAFQNFFKNNELLTKYGPWVYAIIITIVALISIIYINKLNHLIKEKS